MSRHPKRYNLTAIIKDKKGRILSIGKNSYIKTHPVMRELGKKVGYCNDEKINIHAEIDAINKCSNIANAHIIEIYNYSSRSNSYRASKPCSICALGIAETPIKYVVYTDVDLILKMDKLVKN